MQKIILVNTEKRYMGELMEALAYSRGCQEAV